MAIVNVEGRDVYAARMEGDCDVFQSPQFIIAKPRWVNDSEVVTCALCNNKFNQLRRKHHCRQCGRVLCSKCCKEKVPLPQLDLEEPERVCESCRPVCELVTKSRSPMLQFQQEAATGLSQLCNDSSFLQRLVELGGVHTIIALAHVENVEVMRQVMAGLQILSTNASLHRLLADAGAIRAICSLLNRVSDSEEQLISDGISSVMVFCKSSALKTKALEDGALSTVLRLCTSQNEAIALLAVSTLSLIVEHPATHNLIMESQMNTLPRIITLTAAQDETMQEVALKIIAHLSNGTDWHRHRIVQDDFSSGKQLQKVIRSHPKNAQILCNAACIIANLSTSAEDQGGLQDLMVCMCELLASDISSSELLLHVSRSIANFASFRLNAPRLIFHIPDIVTKCVKTNMDAVKMHGLRAILSLLTYLPNESTDQLMRDGAAEILLSLARVPGLMSAVQTSLLAEASDKAKPS